MRLDVWLWRARFFKTRTSASEEIETHGARIERDGQVRRIDKPSTTVASGDLVSFTNAGGPHLLRVLDLPARRGPAPEAALCYERVTASPATDDRPGR
ncbi:MAG: RNA-binding S4 domain-containing protein [Alphaproteobacteria bacterium]|nr:RNA-binding S4 domain-containing protein [Alphaproteobacteria bacterium]